jgi:hypothetical protein
MSKHRDEEIEKYQELIQPHIAYCITCQPYDGGDVVWIFGDRTNLEELFDKYKIPDDLREEISVNLHCQHCERELCRYDDIGLKTQIELEADRRWDDWHQNYDWKIEEFGDFLEKYPYLGLNHEIGEKLHSTISNFPKTDIKEEIWWRARKPKGGKKLSMKDMYPPRFPKAEGRFNHYGQSVFYLASTAEAAMIEILDKGECLAWVQQFTIKEVSNLLDLSSYVSAEEDIPILALGLINVKFPSMVPSKESPWKPEYFIPRFIADCAKHQGFSGIIFNSTNHYERNLVLFNRDEYSILPINEPRILELKRAK